MIYLLTGQSPSFEAEPTFWQKITGHRALFVYLAVLLASLILLMLLLIIRNAREVRTREVEKKLAKEKRRAGEKHAQGAPGRRYRAFLPL